MHSRLLLQLQLGTMFLIHFYKILPRKLGTQFCLIFILSCIVAIVDMLGIASIIPFLSLLLGEDGNSSVNSFPLVAGLTNSLEEFGIVVFLFVVLSGLLKLLVLTMITSFAERIRHLLACQLFDISCHRTFEEFLDLSTHTLAKNLLSELDQGIQLTLKPMLQLFTHGVIVLGISTFLIWLSPITAFCGALGLGLIYWGIFCLVKRPLDQISRELVTSNNDRFRFVSNAFKDIKFLKARRLETFFSELFDESVGRFAQSQKRYSLYAQMPNHIVEIVVFGGFVVLAVSASEHSRLAGGMSVISMPVLGAFGFALFRLKPAMQVVFSSAASLRYSRAALQNLVSSFAEADRSEPATKTINFSVNPDIALDVKDLEFRYGSNEQIILQDVNFKILNGEKVLICGASGSGKSSLLSILLGLLRPWRGEVCFGSSMNKYDPQLGDSDNFLDIGFVPQDVVLISGTVRQNLVLGRSLDHPISDKYLMELIQLVGLESLIASLPDTLDTQIGDGVDTISGGQKKRVGIVRALVSGSPMLIFDEATSGLDAQSEIMILEDIAAQFPNKTMLFVSHNVDSYAFCDKFYRLDAGFLQQINRGQV